MNRWNLRSIVLVFVGIGRVVEAFFEVADAFADAFHQFGNLAPSEKEEDYKAYH